MGPVPKQLNLGSGKTYMPGWLNVDSNERWAPDLVCDLARSIPPDLPKDYFDLILANNILEHVVDLVPLMTNLLALLRDGGVLHIYVPYDLSLGAWQDPTHVRAFNENSWLYYTDWHWYIGWTAHRFDVTRLEYVLSPYGRTLEALNSYTKADIIRLPRAVDQLEVVLTKRPCTPAETAFALYGYAH